MDAEGVTGDFERAVLVAWNAHTTSACDPRGASDRSTLVTVDLREIYHLALSAAEEAGRIHQERLHFERTIETKSSPADAVTEVDRACEELIVSRIVAARSMPSRAI